MTDADPTPDAPEEHSRPKITDRTVSEVVERTRDVIRKTREMLESSRDLLERVRHREGEDKADVPGEDDADEPSAKADESSAKSEASDARPADGHA